MEACHTGGTRLVGGGTRAEEVLAETYDACLPSNSSVIFVGLFYHAVSIAEYVASNGRMIGE
jgi:hypothetical protein